jgi:hypothetical protein
MEEDQSAYIIFHQGQQPSLLKMAIGMVGNF